MFSKLFKKASSFAKRVFNSFSPDEYEETTEEVIRPSAFNWSVSNTYSINNGSNYISEYDLSKNTPQSSTIPRPTSKLLPTPSLDNSISELSQKLLEDARRYPMDFTREELY